MGSIRVGQVYKYTFIDGEATYERVTKVNKDYAETIIIRVDNQKFSSVGEEEWIVIDTLPEYELVLDFNDYYEGVN